jgi:hypothetical protein
MTLNFNQIAPQAVRYIKLGEGGLWEAECLARGIIRFGFGSFQPSDPTYWHAAALPMSAARSGS